MFSTAYSDALKTELDHHYQCILEILLGNSVIRTTLDLASVGIRLKLLQWAVSSVACVASGHRPVCCWPALPLLRWGARPPTTPSKWFLGPRRTQHGPRGLTKRCQRLGFCLRASARWASMRLCQHRKVRLFSCGSACDRRSCSH